MKFLLIAIAVVTAYSQPSLNNSSGSYWSENQNENGRINNQSNLFQRRLSRASMDNLKAPLERLKRVSRIINGIYLQQELIAGNVPPEELISEILFFGSVTPSDIVKMDTQQIQKAIDTMENLPKSLDPTPVITKAETAFKGLSEILNVVDGIGNLKEWKSDSIKSELEKLANTGLDVSYMHTLDGSKYHWNINVARINPGVKVDPTYFAEVRSALMDLKTVIADFDGSKLLWKFGKFSSALDGISTIMKATDGMDMLIKVHAEIEVTKEMEGAYSSFLDVIYSKTSTLNNVNPFLHTAKVLVTNKELKSRNRTLKYTHGLPDGTSDVTAMVYDSGETWIKLIVKSDSLKSAFRQFDDVEHHLRRLESVMEFDKQEINDITKVSKLFSFVNDVFSENLKEGIEQTYACKREPISRVDSTEFDALKASLNAIDERLLKLKDKTDELTELLKTPGISEMCDDVLRICDDAQTIANIDASVKQFGNYGNMNKLKEFFKTLSKILAEITTIAPEEVKTDALDALKNLTTLDTYHTGLNHYAEYFKCLQDQKKLKLVFKMTSAVKEIRLYQSDATHSKLLRNGLEVVKKVTKAKDDLQKLKQAIESMKGYNTIETNGLKVFDQASEHSKVIGEAVQGVTNMKNAMERKNVADKVINNLKTITNNQRQLLDPTDNENIGKLIGLDSVIQNMYSSLNMFNGAVKDNDSPILKSHSKLFESAKSVSGLSANLLEIASSVEKLQEKISNSENLKELQIALKTMSTFGLNFAKYHSSFDASEHTLAALDNFFAKYNTEMEKGKEAEKSRIIVASTAALGIAILIILSASGGYFFLWRPWKARKNMRIFIETLIKDLKLRYDNVYTSMVFGENETYVALFEAAHADDAGARKRCDDSIDSKSEININPKAAISLNGYGKLFSDNSSPAIKIPISKRKSIILSHVPYKGGPNTPRTIGKYYWLAKQNRSKTIVLLDPTVNTMKFLGGDEKLDEHVPLKKGDLLNFEDVSIECLQMETVSDKNRYPNLKGKIEVRQLKVQFQDCKAFEIRHIWYLGWIDESICPKETFDLVYILNMVEKDKTPPIFTSNKLLKAECFAFVLFTRAKCRKESGLTLKKVFEYISEYHADILSSCLHYLLCVLILFELITQDTKIRVNNETREEYENYKQCFANYDQASKALVKGLDRLEKKGVQKDAKPQKKKRNAKKRNRTESHTESIASN
ncbi:unnamed protein product [Caenorhabditis brenneri]